MEATVLVNDVILAVFATILFVADVILAVFEATVFVNEVILDVLLATVFVKEVILAVLEAIEVGNVAMVDELTPPTEFTVGRAAVPPKSFVN